MNSCYGVAGRRRITKPLATRGDLFSRTPFRANVRIAEWAVRPLGVFGDMLMLERQWKTLKLRPWGEARYTTRLGKKE